MESNNFDVKKITMVTVINKNCDIVYKVTILFNHSKKQ
jgi:hypothetical protein